jgi:hypothetical protein
MRAGSVLMRSKLGTGSSSLVESYLGLAEKQDNSGGWG